MIRTLVSARHRERLAAWSMVAPAFCITLVFALYPVVDSLWLSLHLIVVGLPQLGSPFVGLDNYLALIRDPAARQALLVTLAFVVLSRLLELACGLIIALVIHERFRGRGLVRGAILIPWAIPTVVASQLWRYIFNDQYGFANLLLFGGRVTAYIPWLAYPGIAFGIVALADVWKTPCFAALLILAGLQVIPDDLYDAAKVDGAGSVQVDDAVEVAVLRRYRRRDRQTVSRAPHPTREIESNEGIGLPVDSSHLTGETAHLRAWLTRLPRVRRRHTRCVGGNVGLARWVEVGPAHPPFERVLGRSGGGSVPPRVTWYGGHTSVERGLRGRLWLTVVGGRGAREETRPEEDAPPRQGEGGQPTMLHWKNPVSSTFAAAWRLVFRCTPFTRPWLSSPTRLR